MAKGKTWNIESLGSIHQITLTGNKISIDNGANIKLKELPVSRQKGYAAYTIDIYGDFFILFISSYAQPVLTHNGINVETNLPYEPKPLPKWVILFWILFAIDFAGLIGGALGGALNFGGAAVCSTVAANDKLPEKARPFVCLGIWLAFTLAEVLLVVYILNIRYGIMNFIQ